MWHGGVSWRGCHQPNHHARFVTSPASQPAKLAKVELRRDLSPDLRLTRYARLRAIIVSARKKAELSQAAVAARLGRPPSYVADIERSERRIDVIEYLALAGVVGFDPIEVLRQILAVTE